MIDYQTDCPIRHLALEKKRTTRQIARELKLNRKTVCQWVKRDSFQKARPPRRASKLDPFKGDIIRLLERHAYSAQQIFQQIQEHGFEGRYTIVKSFVRQARPQPRPAFLTLHFAPGECAQVDWGCAGSVPVGSTHRRLSFFVMVLAFSRKRYVEFTLAEKLEHFLACHQRAFEYFGGVVQQVWVDNCKVAVLSRSPGVIQFHPRYLDLAHHYGFQIRACGVGQPQEKGRVENGVGYVKKNFLNGLELFVRFLALSPQAPEYYRQLEARRLNPKHQVQKIVALSEIYGVEAVARALADAFTYQAFSCEYIAHILQQRQPPPPESGALHLTRQQDQLEWDLPAPDLSLDDDPQDTNPSAPL
jgi:transposase